jgi:deoxyadenosine/deoxycytidine kinase
VLIAVEGLPGAGKTTTARQLGERLEAESLLEATAAHPFLEKVYADGGRDDLIVELSFLVLHAAAYRARVEREGDLVSDYSPVKDVLFARDMLSAEALQVFLATYEGLYRDPLPDLVIYLALDAEHSLARVQRRSKTNETRTFEAGLTLERMQRMYELYTTHSSQLGKCVVMVDVDEEMSPEQVTDAALKVVRERIPRERARGALG